MLFGAIPLTIALVIAFGCLFRSFYIQTFPKRFEKNIKFGIRAEERVFFLSCIVFIATLFGMEKTQSIEYKLVPCVISDGGDYVAAKVKDQPTIIFKSDKEMALARSSKFIYEIKIWKYMGTGPIRDWTFVKPDSPLAKEVQN